jgi:hypothetical protein
MKRALFPSLGLCLALASLPGTCLGSTWQASAPASVNITESAGIEIITPLALPTVQVSDGSAFVASDASNAQLTIHGQAGDVLSMAVPDKLTLVRSGGSEALTADTSAVYGLAGRGVVLGGELINGNAMSVDIGGKLSLASSDHLVPGPYEGLFVVVVQYN